MPATLEHLAREREGRRLVGSVRTLILADQAREDLAEHRPVRVDDRHLDPGRPALARRPR